MKKHSIYNVLKENKNIKTFYYDIWVLCTGGQRFESPLGWVGRLCSEMLTMGRVIWVNNVNGSKQFGSLITYLIIWYFVN